MNSQDLILERIADAIGADDNLVLIHDREYGNMGVLRTLDSKTLRQIAAVSYDFQRGYCSFGSFGNRLASLWYGQSAEGKAAWVKDSIPDLVDAVVRHLKGGSND